MCKSKICFFFQTKLLLIIVCIGSVKYQSYFVRLLTIVDFGTEMPRCVAHQLSTLALYGRLSIHVFMRQFYWLCMAVEVPLAPLDGQNKYAWSKSTIVEIGRTRVNLFVDILYFERGDQEVFLTFFSFFPSFFRYRFLSFYRFCFSVPFSFSFFFSFSSRDQ